MPSLARLSDSRLFEKSGDGMMLASGHKLYSIRCFHKFYSMKLLTNTGSAAKHLSQWDIWCSFMRESESPNHTAGSDITDDFGQQCRCIVLAAQKSS